MMSSAEAYRRGLDDATELARKHLSEVLGFDVPNFGTGVAEVVLLKRKLYRLQQDLEDLKLELKERADWK